MIRYQVHLEKSQLKAMQAIAKNGRLTIAEHIRIALDRYIKKEGKK